jgi:hypothetical protein
MPRVRKLSDRELTLALLARQLLLERRRIPADRAVQRLGALQAQYSPSPYVALHSRLDGFRVTELEAALARGRVVKATLMRGTLHLVHQGDYPAFAGAWHRQARAERLGPVPAGMAAEVAAFARTPRTTDEIRAFVLDRVVPVPGVDPLNIARELTALVHVPPSGSFGRHGKFSVVSWPGPLVGEPAATTLVLRRYLGAFGPATREDIAAFTYFRYQQIDAALAALEPLRRFTDGRGRDLLDLPRAPVPAEDTATPVRLLARWDAAVLSHRDRSRILPPRFKDAVVKQANGDFLPTFLVDGLIAGSWSHTVRRDAAVLALRPLGGALPADIEPEADRMLAFLAPSAARRTIEVS